MGAAAHSASAPAPAPESHCTPQGAAQDVADDGLSFAMSTPLPAAVQGTMNGEKPPMSKAEDIKRWLEPYRHYLQKLRSWREFVRLSRPGSGEVKARLEANLSYYQINYAVIFLALMAISIVTNPRCVAVICVLALVWMAFLKKNDDPSWEVSIRGMALGKTQRWMCLIAITAIALLCAAGHVISSAAFVCGVLVLSHAFLHSVEVAGHVLSWSEVVTGGANADEVTDLI